MEESILFADQTLQASFWGFVGEGRPGGAEFEVQRSGCDALRAVEFGSTVHGPFESGGRLMH